VQPAAAGRGGRRAALLRQAIAIACVFALLAFARLASDRGRVSSPDSAVVRVGGGPEAVEVWRQAQVRGRTLVHLSRRIAMRAEPDQIDPGPITEDNYLYAALRENLIRRVYHVIPDDEWADVERNLRDFPGAARVRTGFRLEMEGAPVLVLRAGDLPRVKERVLVNVDMDRWSGEELGTVIDRLALTGRSGAPPADLVTWWGSSPGASGPAEVLSAAVR